MANFPRLEIETNEADDHLSAFCLDFWPLSLSRDVWKRLVLVPFLANSRRKHFNFHSVAPNWQ